MYVAQEQPSSPLPSHYPLPSLIYFPFITSSPPLSPLIPQCTKVDPPTPFFLPLLPGSLPSHGSGTSQLPPLDGGSKCPDTLYSAWALQTQYPKALGCFESAWVWWYNNVPNTLETSSKHWWLSNRFVKQHSHNKFAYADTHAQTVHSLTADKCQCLNENGLGHFTSYFTKTTCSSRWSSRGLITHYRIVSIHCGMDIANALQWQALNSHSLASTPELIVTVQVGINPVTGV